VTSDSNRDDPMTPEAVVRAVRAVRRDLDVALTEHPSADELASYVDGELDETGREAVALHLEECAACREELADLRTLQADMAGAATRTRAGASRTWLALAASVAIIAAAAVGASRWWRGRDTTAPTATVSTPAPAVAATATLVDGSRRIDIMADGRTRGLESLAAEDRDVVERTLQAGRAPVAPLVARLRVDAGPLMGGPAAGAAFAAVAPAGLVVERDRPVFRWTAARGAREYRVTVLDARQRIAAESGPLQALEWTPPASLARGAEYSWQVSAAADGGRVVAPSPPAPEARFAVLDRETADAIAQARRRYAGSHLVIGILASQAGLVDEAEREFAALAAQNPDSPIAASLLQQATRIRRP